MIFFFLKLHSYLICTCSREPPPPFPAPLLQPLTVLESLNQPKELSGTRVAGLSGRTLRRAQGRGPALPSARAATAAV